MKSVLCYTLGVELPSTKFRIVQYEKFFKSRNIEIKIVHIAGKSVRAKRTLFNEAKCHDVVILQKKLLGIVWLKYLLSANNRLCYDLDDALYAREPYVEKKRGYRPGTFIVRHKLHATLTNVPCVIAGNRILGDYVRRYNRNVAIIPTPIDTDVYTCYPRSNERDEFILGWIGTSKNQFYLQNILPELLQFLNDFPGSSFQFMSNRDIINCTHDRVVFRRWSAGGEIEFLRGLSVGLMPLTDDEWSRGKCAFKVLQYMAAGRPVIASSVGMNAEVIEHGSSGLLAERRGDWYHHLKNIYGHPELCKRMGRRARQVVLDNYSLEKCGQRLLSTLTQLYERYGR